MYLIGGKPIETATFQVTNYAPGNRIEIEMGDADVKENELKMALYIRDGEIIAEGLRLGARRHDGGRSGRVAGRAADGVTRGGGGSYADQVASLYAGMDLRKNF